MIQEIPYSEPSIVFRAFAAQPGAILLESAQHLPDFGRYSFVMADPWQVLESRQGKTFLADEEHPMLFFDLLQQQLEFYSLSHRESLPPFQGGVAGYLGYETGQLLETLPQAIIDEHGMPEAWLGFYDAVIAFDHKLQRAWIISSGLPEQEELSRQQRAKERLQWLQGILHNGETTPFQKTWGQVEVQSDVSESEYCTAVQRVVDYIYAGDIYQANYSRRLRAKLPTKVSAYDLYERLTQVNPAPFAAFLNTKAGIIASASPERFLKLEGQQVQTKPIKGTRRRSSDLLEDQQIANELLASEKDRAENIMIVDLLRNDLSRVCAPHSVQVPQLLELESYATVHHLVTTVVGELEPLHGPIDLLKTTFPGGSITGAPKIRSMEIITELEGQARGPFYGSIGYIGFSGMMDTNIVIRTFVIQEDQVTFQVGGGIVADSDPQGEYDESTTKALGMMRALGADCL
ncbi:aminodeoxychorismate synthase component I [Candidatus Paracaedibacter symbiosus]|uniref:aminodeoxychorismate synthase component I n=1 Tax=Candidatus Paracaedibacter symbiosus TaxID=244582 RepID=UPI000509534A|nr:aminodeoxychorismate synthase component I [Candidatus Paracaedibacter symbiosus]